MMQVALNITAWVILLIGISEIQSNGGRLKNVGRLCRIMGISALFTLSAFIFSLYIPSLRAFIALVLTALPGGLIAALIRYAMTPTQR